MADAEIIRLDSRTRAGRTGPSRAQARVRCRATTSTGRPCRNYATAGTGYCAVHARAQSAHPAQGSPAGQAPVHVGEAPSGPVAPSRQHPGVEEFVRRRLAGDYEVDDFGYDPELARQVLLPLAGPLYERYFRVKTLGVERIPNTGPALLVGNHSGTVAIDAVMVQYAVATEHPNERAIRNIGADLVYQLPFIGAMARKTGNAVATDEDAEELLRRGELVGVYPEGYKGVGKGWRERYKLQRFGRGGFMETALRSRVPIIPVAVVGAEEAFPMIANAKWLARILGFPYFPITPTFPLLGPLGLLPLPSKWLIEFGDPIPMDDYPDDAADDAMLVFDLADRVRDTIQQMLYRNLQKRKGAFF
ncbi:MAG TPA: lysophospholipid acyltransferase family protein [Actinomycetota bacterium]|nr:lysophospholipid acyltransferase family protein [Actinomycetota bacterium]